MYNEDEVLKAVWKIQGEKVKYTTEDVFKILREYVRVPGYEYDVGIGTDSQMIGHAFQFISVISAHRVGKGGIYFFNKEFVSRAKFPVENQKLRMFDEVTRSINLGLVLQEKTKICPNVHVDASPSKNKKEFTSKFSEELRGYVQACGFPCLLKPESYVAHAIADRHTKKRTRKRRAQAKFHRSK